MKKLLAILILCIVCFSCEKRIIEEPHRPVILIQVFPIGSGTVSPSGVQVDTLNWELQCDYGQQVWLTPTANEGYRFVRWDLNAEGTDVPLLVSVDHSKIIIVKFEPIKQ